LRVCRPGRRLAGLAVPPLSTVTPHHGIRPGTCSGHPKRNLCLRTFGRARLQQQHLGIRVLGQTRRDNRSSRSGAHHDVVVRSHLSSPSRFKVDSAGGQVFVRAPAPTAATLTSSTRGPPQSSSLVSSRLARARVGGAAVLGKNWLVGSAHRWSPYAPRVAGPVVTMLGDAPSRDYS
jgi:hypothetical protein